MAWEKKYSEVVKDLSVSDIWKVWVDVNQWHLWDLDIEYARLEVPFEEGAPFQLKPQGGPKVKLKLLRVERHRAFTDVTTFPLAKMYGIHQMQATDKGLVISHTVRIEGPLSFLWRKIVAEKVAAGLSEQSSRMLERARKLRANDKEEKTT